MQAVELEVDITADGRVNTYLPSSYRSWFGGHAKLIMLLPEMQAEDREQKNKKKLLAQAWGCVEKPKTLAEIDRDIAQMRQEWE